MMAFADSRVSPFQARSARRNPRTGKLKLRYRAIALRCRLARADGLVFDQIYLGTPLDRRHDGTTAYSTFMVLVPDADGTQRPRKLGAHLFDPVRAEHARFFLHHLTGQADREAGWYTRVRESARAGAI